MAPLWSNPCRGRGVGIQPFFPLECNFLPRGFYLQRVISGRNAGGKAPFPAIPPPMAFYLSRRRLGVHFAECTTEWREGWKKGSGVV